MAFRINTVEYGWETNQASQSGSIAYSAPAKIITIAETGSRTFLSVDLEAYLRDASTGTTPMASITTFGMSCSIDGNSGGGTSFAGTIQFFTLDHSLLFFKQSITDHFNTRFTGSQHSISPSIYFQAANANVWTGHSFKITATYQFDDTNVTTCTKTIRLPLDAIYSRMGTSQTVFGKSTGGYTNIPALDTFLPETSKKYNDIWIQYVGNDASTATTSVNMITQIDSGSENSRFVLSGSMNTDTAYYDIQTVSGTLDTSTAHTLKARASLSNRLNFISPTVYVTYNYDPSSPYVINNIIVPCNREFYENYNFAHTDRVSFGLANFLIPEPSISNLLHSAFIAMYPAGTSGATATVNIGNAVILNGVACSRGTTRSSNLPVNVRFDSEAASSTNFNITSGFNVLPISLKITTTPQYPETFNGYFLLTYSGSNLNNNYGNNKILTFSSGTFGSPASVSVLNRYNYAPTRSIHTSLTESYYFNPICEVYQSNLSNYSPSATMNGALTYMYILTGSDGRMTTLTTRHGITQTNATGVCNSFSALDMFKQYPNQPDISKLNYFNPTNNVLVQHVNTTSKPVWRTRHITYNQNINRITGSLLNCSQTSVDYKVDIYLSGSNVPIESIYNLTTSGSGATKTFMFDWYESINKLYAVTEYPEQGISNMVTASNGNILTIDYAPTGGSTEKSFTFIG